MTAGSDVIASIAFRWLKIQDVSDAARQPMSRDDGRLWITFNGEIYNFGDLRTELQSANYAFTTHSDTEVALAAYSKWGTGCFERFNGMWAMVIVDLHAGQVVISRDRVGIKPLYCSTDGDSLLFSSEAKQIAMSASGRPRPDLDSLARYVANHRPRAGASYFEGIEAFPAATFAMFPLGEAAAARHQAYWDLATSLQSQPLTSYDIAVDETDAMLRSAVDLQLLADVEVGTLLSGGLDSSLVTAIAAQLGVARPSFSFVLPYVEDRAIDETPYIDAVSQHSGVPNHKTTFDPGWVLDNFARVTRAQESPVTGLPVVAQFRTHELASSLGVRVVLDGQGADESFAGYQRHQAILLNELLSQGRVLSFIEELRAFARRSRDYPKLYLRQGLLAPVRARFDPPHRRSAPWFIPLASDDPRPSAPRGTSLLQQGLFRDITQVNIPSVLGITDRNSMAHSLEARVPMLDHRLIELAFRMPSHFKVSQGQRKKVLRSVADRYIPRAVIDRTDSIGFGTPQRRWISNEMRSAIRDAQHDEVFSDPSLFDARAIREETNPNRLWMIFALRTWMREFSVA